MSKQVSVEEFKTAMMAVVEKGTDRAGLSEDELKEVTANEEICREFVRQRIPDTDADTRAKSVNRMKEWMVEKSKECLEHLLLAWAIAPENNRALWQSLHIAIINAAKMWLYSNVIYWGDEGILNAWTPHHTAHADWPERYVKTAEEINDRPTRHFVTSLATIRALQKDGVALTRWDEFPVESSAPATVGPKEVADLLGKPFKPTA